MDVVSPIDYVGGRTYPKCCGKEITLNFRGDSTPLRPHTFPSTSNIPAVEIVHIYAAGRRFSWTADNTRLVYVINGSRIKVWRWTDRVAMGCGVTCGRAAAQNRRGAPWPRAPRIILIPRVSSILSPTWRLRFVCAGESQNTTTTRRVNNLTYKTRENEKTVITILQSF